MTNTARVKRCPTRCCVFGFFGVALLFVHQAAAQPLDRNSLAWELTRVIDQDPITRRTDVCLRVDDLETGATLYDRHGDRLMTPASNLKMYTTACALAKFGPQHRFTTTAILNGELSQGRLTGDLVLLGGGDPMLSATHLSLFAQRIVKELGLTEIAGAVRVDNSRYASPLKGPGWMWDDDPYYFNMSITPLMLDFNVLTVRVSTSADGETSLELRPPSDYPPVLREQGQTGQTLRITRRPFEHPIRVIGVGKAGSSQEERRTMHDPGQWVASVFQKMLVTAGVTFEERTVPDRNVTQDKLRIEHQGAPLQEILKHFNEESENAIGEVLLHEIAIASECQCPTWPDGARVLTNWLVDEAGLEDGSFRFVDGSGLSRYNLISGQSSIRLLAHMHRHERAADFMAALPTYDVDVSKIRWQEPLPPGAGKAGVHAKSGFMSGVLTSSGFIRTLDDRRLAFSYLTAGFIGSSQPQRDLRQQLWEVLVRFREQR